MMNHSVSCAFYKLGNFLRAPHGQRFVREARPCGLLKLSDQLSCLEYGACAHAELMQAKSEEQRDCGLITGHLAAHADPFAFLLRRLNNEANEAKQGGVPRL